jgi:hypothetical protein
VKITLNYNISSVNSESEFYKILDGIEPIEIPTEYIDYLEIYYIDNSCLELKSDDLKYIMPISTCAPKKELQEIFKKMKEVRIFLNLEYLEKSINESIDKILNQ